MAQVVILFGAGASYGSQESNKPPLGKNLFKSLCNEYSDLESLLAKFNEGVLKKFKYNFELGMEWLFSHSPPEGNGDINHRIYLNLANYIRKFKPDSIQNSYIKLMKGFLERGLINNLAISTINYDLLLEYTIRDLGLYYSYEEKKDSIRLLKLHGSPTFIHNSKGLIRIKNLTIKGGISDNFNISDSADERKVFELEELDNIYKNENVRPIFAYYMKRKPSLYGSDLIKKQQEQWKIALQNSNTIVIVGVSYIENDDHIWSPVLTGNRFIYYIGDESSKDNIVKVMPHGSKLVYGGNNFDESLNDIFNTVQNSLN